MVQTTWLLLFALQLPATDPVRARAIETLTQRLAEHHQEARRLEEDDGASGECR